MKISVVIIANNEAHIISRALASVAGLTDDIVVIDSGSTDDTVSICKSAGARVIESAWLGYGKVKNLGNSETKYDWILSLDADEAVDEILRLEIKKLKNQPDNIVYRVNRKSFFCNKMIRYGVWGSDTVVRLFNRKVAEWDTSEVHENLHYFGEVRELTLKGSLLHYTVNSLSDYSTKTLAYAQLSAKKYFQKGKSSGIIKIYFAPAFSFFRYYIFRLGFLDGFEGYLICRTYAWYTFMKYVLLREMIKEAERK